MQTKLAEFATNKINEDFGTDLRIKKVDLSLLGSVEFKGIEIRDHHKDTLIFVGKLSTSILNAKKVLEGDVNLKSISLTNTYYNLKTYKGEKDDAFSMFLDSFDDGEPDDPNAKPFILSASNIYLDNFNFQVIDENNEDPISFSAKNAGGNLEDFGIVGSEVNANIRGLYFIDNRNIEITNLTTNYKYSKTAMDFKNTVIETPNSSISADIRFNYKRQDLSDFNNKVNIKANFKKSQFSIIDLKKLYNEVSGNDILNFTGNLNGTLNSFSTTSLNLISDKGIKVIGDLKFVNAINSNKGFVFEADLDNLTANYEQLKNILPNLLGNTLPTEFQRFGNFTIFGKTKITEESIDARLTVNSEIGTTISDLQLTNIQSIDEAGYFGEIEFKKFDLGAFFKNPLFGIISFKGDVNGSGFKIDNINTQIKGSVSEVEFKNYKYRNIVVDGKYQNNLFDGNLIIDDENLEMKFEGLADFSSAVHEFDFKADIGNLNLNKTNLFKRDSLSVVEGKIDIDIKGNTLDDITGKAIFKDVLYVNQKQAYIFKEFEVTSSIKEDIKTIKIDSRDIVNGELKGRFLFADLLPLSQNALGSIYANYNPYKVAQDQFIDFNFSIYNKIIGVFLPDVFIDKNTKIKGKIQGNKNAFKLTVSSPKIVAYDNEIKDLLLRTDNQNSLYNTHLTASKISTKYYNVSKLNLLNRTKNDTLFFKSIFKGGKLDKENFNVDFYYTINEDKKSVLGFEKSTIGHRNNTWEINPDENRDNKITFDLKSNEFDFSPFQLVSGEQKVDFTGFIKNNIEKTLLADFTKVNLESFLPSIDSLALKGVLNGSIDFVEKKGLYNPQGVLLIKDFQINQFKQGDLAINVRGDNSYEKYKVDLSLEREDVKSIGANGSIDFSTTRPTMDLGVFLEDFEINAFSPLGQDVLSKIRGKASGDFTLKGPIGNPSMEGSLSLRNAGLMFPYLNTDYNFEGESIITLKEQQFIFEEIKLVDTKHNSSGRLLGSIVHQNFSDWFMDLEIVTDNLLVLDTEDSEESLYYGTAFIKGDASITGLTDQLTIEVNATTQPNTVFVLPLKDIETVDNYKLIHFKSENDKDKKSQEAIAINALKGLVLNINLQVTKDATAQVVIDEVNGSQLKGSGNGDLRIEIDTRGKFNMFGDFTIETGVYDFKYGGIINKPFQIQKGGTVSWNGSPLDAVLNVTAIYQTKANPAILLENFNTSRKIPIDLITKISGGLFNSQQEFDIAIPNANSNIASELNFVLNDNNINQKTTQFISLLALGSFANPDKNNFDSNAAIAGTASSAIAAAFSSLLNNPDSKFQLGVDYTQGRDTNEVENLNTDNVVDVSVTTQISDRVIVNGKVGVPVGTKTQSSVVGEVKVEILLNEQGNLRVVIFNRQNEIQYSTQEEGYTQGVGLSYQVDFNSLSGLLRKIGLKNKKSKKVVKKDSILSPHSNLVNFKSN